MQSDFVVPSVTLDGFNCSHCGAYAHQEWYRLCALSLGPNNVPLLPKLTSLAVYSPKPRNIDSRTSHMSPIEAHHLRTLPILRISPEQVTDRELMNAWISECAKCREVTIWISRHQIWPVTGAAPAPHPDMPKSVREGYDEARSIMDRSPRAAAALLRLAVENLCDGQGAKGKSLFHKIGHLVGKDLPDEVRDSLDTVRVVAGDGMHTGQIQHGDHRGTVSQLFELVNFIVEERISRPERLKNLRKGFSKGALDAIEKRDTKGSSSGEP